MKPFDLNEHGIFSNNFYNLYNKKLKEADAIAICNTSLAKNRFKQFVINTLNDEITNSGGNESVNKFIKLFNDKVCGILALDSDDFAGYFYCISTKSWYYFSISYKGWINYNKVSFNSIISNSKKFNNTYNEETNIITKEEFNTLLEEAFIAGYIDAEEDYLNKDNSFDLEREYNNYYGEATAWERIQFGIERFKNKRKYSDPKLRGLANKVAAAKIGTQRAANNMDKVVMDTYGKYGRDAKDKLMDANTGYTEKKRTENRYSHKLKLAEKERANRPADNKSKQPKPVFRPAFA